jgi:hypothetical protein
MGSNAMSISERILGVAYQEVSGFPAAVGVRNRPLKVFLDGELAVHKLVIGWLACLARDEDVHHSNAGEGPGEIDEPFL